MREFRRIIPQDDLRKVDLVHYLEYLGFYPAKPSKNGIDFYYLSPLRDEKEPSFHINRKDNVWYDHGLGEGGWLADFGMRYFKCRYREFMWKCADEFSLRPVIQPKEIKPEIQLEKESKIIVLSEHPLYSYPLINYLHDRMIPRSVAEKYCCELTYETAGRPYYGIGFKNNSDGYEIRNPSVKLSTSPKDITVIRNGAKEVQVFEGFFDFLTYQTMCLGGSKNAHDFVVLNGAAMFERARPVLEKYERIELWLDRDTTGLAYTKYALSLSDQYKDKSLLYDNYKDLNAMATKTPLVNERLLKQQKALKRTV